MPAVRSFLPLTATVALLALPAMTAAQARGRTTRDTVPVSMLPPAGKCRIWMAGVPASQQPAPTDCATALRQRPSSGVILYGPTPRDAATERFDPKVGTDTRKRAVDNAGSPAEQELRKRREEDQRQRRIEDARERDERARRDAAERAMIGSRGGSSGASSTPSAPRGTTAQPRTTTGNSTGSSTAPPAAPASKAPPEAKRKPE